MISTRLLVTAALFALVNVAFSADMDFNCDMIKDKKIRAACVESEKKKRPDRIVEAQKESVRTAKTLVANKMLDPAAAQFKEVVYIESDLQKADGPARHVVCGQVNAKNSYGGYVGFAPFWVDFGTNGIPNVMVCGGDSRATEACLMGSDIYCSKAVRKSIPEDKL